MQVSNCAKRGPTFDGAWDFEVCCFSGHLLALPAAAGTAAASAASAAAIVATTAKAVVKTEAAAEAAEEAAATSELQMR